MQLAGRRGVLLQLRAEISCSPQILVLSHIPSWHAVFWSSVYQSFVEKPQDDQVLSLLIWSRLLTAVHAESALTRVIWKADLSCQLPVLPNPLLSPLTSQDRNVYYHSQFWWQCRDLFSSLLDGMQQRSCWEQQTSSSICKEQNPTSCDILGVETVSFKGKLTRKTVSKRCCWFWSSVNMNCTKHPHKPPKEKTPTALAHASWCRTWHWCVSCRHVFKPTQAHQQSIFLAIFCFGKRCETLASK